MKMEVQKRPATHCFKIRSKYILDRNLNEKSEVTRRISSIINNDDLEPIMTKRAKTPIQNPKVKEQLK